MTAYCPNEHSIFSGDNPRLASVEYPLGAVPPRNPVHEGERIPIVEEQVLATFSRYEL